MVWTRTLATACALAFPIATCSVIAQPSQSQVASTPLALSQAETIALANQPRMLASQERARAAAARIREARSAYFPAAAFNATGALVADAGTATAAGALTTSSISDRFAYGGQLTQLVTDFGRTSALVGSSRSSALAQSDLATLTRAQVRLNVRDAYYQVLGAEAVLRAARAAQTNRHLVAKQLNALAQSELRSTVDVNFAEVLASEADLAVVQAQSVVAQQRARLATAMGTAQAVTASLVEPIAPGALPPAPDSLQSEAQNQRADLGAAEAQQHAAEQFATAEKRLSYPTLGVGAAGGEIPYHDHTLQNSYAAAAFNLNIPIFNGGLFAARRAEAQSEANARANDVRELHLEVTEQVRNSWQRANEAFQSLAVTTRLVAQTKEALRLAQARYDSGLGSIVELNEAQVNETSAEISAADANYTYLSRRAELDFAAGLLN
ncbi:TolC family protein [Granulicella sp. 5B5]|uniref:TolC family protein n=1 Tax=Granulicella sp. 5B5 TaxID=1617967 RepID=UPI0015F64507|nr:TolC family protein [Granulicella sp. 5B5]QMV18434.1 TolC family protein [Granulicella sp. 5B5]